MSLTTNDSVKKKKNHKSIRQLDWVPVDQLIWTVAMSSISVG